VKSRVLRTEQGFSGTVYVVRCVMWRWCYPVTL